MTWGAQVMHVAWKDVRQAKWMMMAYVAIAVAAAISVSNMQTGTARSFAAVPFLLWILGFFAIAVVVQHDSPIDARAAWRSVPYERSAMFGAKLLLLYAVMVGLPGVLQIVALAKIGVAPSLYVAFLADSVAPTAAFLPLCLLISVSTINFKSFAFLLVIALVAHLAIDAMLPDSFSWILPSNRARVGVQLIWSAVVLAFAALRYLAAPRQHYVWLGAFILLDAFVGVVTPWSAKWTADESIAPTAHGDFARVPLQFDEIQLSNGKDASQIDVSVAARLDSAHARVILSSIAIDFADANHQSHEPYPFPSSPWGVKQLSVALTPVRHTAADTAEIKTSWNQNLSNFATVAAHKLDTGAVANVSAIVNVLDAHVLGRVPFALGAKVSSNGQHYEIVHGYNERQRTFEVRSVGVQRTSSERHSYIFDDSVEFALVNRKSGEVVELTAQKTIASSSPTVLPGPSILEVERQLNPIHLSQSQMTTEWLGDADFVVVVWRPQYSYPVKFNGIKVRQGSP